MCFSVKLDTIVVGLPKFVVVIRVSLTHIGTEHRVFPWFSDALEGLERSGRLLGTFPPIIIRNGLDGVELWTKIRKC